ncbi:MAG TPA: hypothetical protein VHE61_17540 [Opitutaceae bacterium]|nr:hypothetical protein [Opitutaceae bacterium]
MSSTDNDPLRQHLGAPAAGRGARVVLAIVLVTVLVGVIGAQRWFGREADASAATRAAAQSVPAAPPKVTLCELPAMAEVAVAGGAFVRPSGDSLSIDVPPAGTDVEIRAPLFHNWRGHIDGASHPAVLAVSLEPVQPHTVTFTGLPSGALVAIGDMQKIADARGRVEFELLPGAVSVRASARDFRPYAQALEIRDDAVEIPIRLQRIAGNGPRSAGM